MRLLVIASALALAACMPQAPQQTPNQQQANGAPASAASPSNKGDGQAAAPAPESADNKGAGQSDAPAAGTIDARFMIGRWGDNGDCTKDIVINADSTFTSYSGGQGRWSLRGDTLRLEGDNGTFDMRLELIDHDTVRITNPDGSVGTSQRC